MFMQNFMQVQKIPTLGPPELLHSSEGHMLPARLRQRQQITT
jgi:hypothetical protein